MIEHKLPPQLCASCYREVIDRAPAMEGKHAVYCTENEVLAFIRVDQGCLKRWRLIGPVSEAEAHLITEMSEVALTAIEQSAETGH